MHDDRRSRHEKREGAVETGQNPDHEERCQPVRFRVGSIACHHAVAAAAVEDLAHAWWLVMLLFLSLLLESVLKLLLLLLTKRFQHFDERIFLITRLHWRGGVDLPCPNA